jgi:hypothetical protein
MISDLPYLNETCAILFICPTISRIWFGTKKTNLGYMYGDVHTVYEVGRIKKRLPATAGSLFEANFNKYYLTCSFLTATPSSV